MRRFEGALDRIATPLVAVASVAFTVAYALIAGPDSNWDLRNYHYWVVHAFLNGTTFVDVGPAQLLSWNNPLVFVPSYLVVKYTSPLVGTAIEGAWAGIAGLLLYLLAVRTVATESPRRRISVGLLVTACGITGAMFLTQVGTSFSDPLTSILVIAGLLVLYWSSSYRFLLSGLLVGAAVGLKLTCAPFAVGLAVALLAGWRSWDLSVGRYLGLALGGILGVALTAGYWSWLLYVETGNPLFPFYNEIFKSSLYEHVNFYDPRYLPESLLDAISYPFQWVIGRYPSSDWPFRDARFALAALGLILALVSLGLRRRREPHERETVDRDFHFFAIFFVVSFAVWIMVWGVSRYITVLELLTGLLLYLSVDRLPLSLRLRQWGFVGAVALCVVWTQPAYRHRPDNPSDRYFPALDQHELTAPKTLYIMVGGGQPMSYMIPSFPKDARFVRLTGNFGDLTPDRPLAKLAGEAIARHVGPVRTLTANWHGDNDGKPPSLEERDLKLLAAHGLEPDHSRACVEFDTVHDIFQSCPLIRSTYRSPERFPENFPGR